MLSQALAGTCNVQQHAQIHTRTHARVHTCTCTRTAHTHTHTHACTWFQGACLHALHQVCGLRPPQQAPHILQAGPEAASTHACTAAIALQGICRRWGVQVR